MSEREDDILAVSALGHLDTCYINWFSEGGGEVHRIWDMLFLFEIPQYGGEGNFRGSFRLDEIEKLVTLAHSWT